jgi:hypothetical protein
LPFEVTLYEDLMTDYVFDPDVLVDGPRGANHLGPRRDLQADDVRPMLQPCARTWMDDEAVIHFSLPLTEPTSNDIRFYCGAAAAVSWLCRRTRASSGG